jgi:hypothetical protein
MDRHAETRHDSPLVRWTRALHFPVAPLATRVDLL